MEAANNEVNTIGNEDEDQESSKNDSEDDSEKVRQYNIQKGKSKIGQKMMKPSFTQQVSSNPRKRDRKQ